ncbi:MAG: LL-diaminopimelate aminotransferase [Candidatus Alcyoniella australis]|nr:LL-diaminopimelate aminotransferase [Candidatus Alcyoniella australis]
MKIKPSERIGKLPPYLFADLDRQRSEVLAAGVDVIDLGVGDPDLPTPEPIVEELCRAAHDKSTHRYPSYRGMMSLREAAAAYLRRRFDLELDPATQICALVGSKEGIFHLPIGLLDQGDAALVPDPAYPVYRAATLLAGGRPLSMPLLRENGFKPDLAAIDSGSLDRCKLMFLNYPNNPTGATVDLEFYADAARFAGEHSIAVAADAAYVEMGFDGYRPPSFLQAAGALDVGIEFHSLSKPFSMTGWRIGFAAGNPELIAALAAVKTNADSGAFNAVQYAAICALQSDFSWVEQHNAVYAARRNLVLAGLREIGLWSLEPQATFYVWFSCPEAVGSAEFASRLLRETGVLVTPGVGFGAAGEGYCRIALTVGEERLSEAMERLGKFKL